MELIYNRPFESYAIPVGGYISSGFAALSW